MTILKKHSFVKNFVSILSGQTLSLLFNFVSFTLIARYLGVEEFGIFSYTLALVTILSKLTDLGVSPIAFRESSKESDGYTILSTSISLRIILFILILFLFNVFAQLFSLTMREIILSDILFINIIISAKFQNIRELLDIPFKISLSSHLPMIAVMMDNFLFLLLVILIPFFKIKLLYVVIAYVVSNIPGFIFILYKLAQNHSYRFRFILVKWKWLLRESASLLIYVILIAIFQQIDLLILKNIDSDFSTGIYSAALRLTLPLMIIPSAIVSTIFPTVVKNVAANEEQNVRINKFIYKLLFFIAFTITALVGIKARTIVILVFGQKYSEAYLPMIFLLITQIFLFYNFHTINLLTAYNKQKKIIIYAAVLMILNLILNLILIPLFSYNGAGASKLIAVSAGTFILTYIISKEGLNFNFIKARIILWSILIFGVLYILSYLYWPLYFISAIFIIILISLKFNYFEDDEVLMIFKLINREKWGRALIKI